MTGQPALPANVSVFPTPTRSLHTLPPQPTPLLGRDPEVAAIQARLADPSIRLLTLTGPGGTGKTRLAVGAAAGLVDHFPHGVVFVDLVPIRDAALVPATIAQALDVRQTEARPSPPWWPPSSTSRCWWCWTTSSRCWPPRWASGSWWLPARA